MRQLILLRHAEAQPKQAGISDFDRALTGHGRTEALDAAACLKQAAIRLDAVLVSPALRARETALIVAAQLDFDQKLLYDDILYHGDAQALLGTLQRCNGHASSVLLVGHNPSVSMLARRLADALPTNPEQRAHGPIDGHAPDAPLDAPNDEPLELHTAGLCRVQFQTDSWRDLEPASVIAVSLLR
jgi:phosphohistidine phosphatase